MTRKYFGTDGIRGTVGQPPITPDFVLRLAHAVGRVLKKTESRPRVLIGKDTRISGYMLESALESQAAYERELKAVGYGPITTEIIEAPEFFYAEDYHQQYLAKNPDGYCGVGGTGVVCPIGVGVRA